MKLSQCSKTDLLWIIDRLRMMRLSGFDSYLNRALSDLLFKKTEERLDAANKYMEISCQKRQEWIELLAPYVGLPIKDIPLQVLEQADALLKAAQAADKKWGKLMKIQD